MDNQIDITTNNYAQISFGGNQSPTDVTGGYNKIAIGNPAFQIQLFGFAFSNNKLRYNGASRRFNINLLALMCHDGSQVERELRATVFKNGNPIGEAFGKVSSTGSNIFKAVSFNTEIDLAPGDVLEAMISNATGTEKITVKDFKLTITSK